MLITLNQVFSGVIINVSAKAFVGVADSDASKCSFFTSLVLV